MKHAWFVFGLAALAGVNWEWFLDALAKSRTSMKAAALDMGISEAQLSRQVRGQEHMHVDRLERLPLLFRQWYHLNALGEVGLPEDVIKARSIARALRTRKRMASMSEASVDQKRGVA